MSKWNKNVKIDKTSLVSQSKTQLTQKLQQENELRSAVIKYQWLCTATIFPLNYFNFNVELA
jgi:hypothetical protein